ncbi:hypothetical protein [Variovorax sp. GT1P44]|uniref:hypothetical protein n=1 Tax=Variovorax sp. GT1P44 TaxID=3443742 RepID=UPI003F48ABE8
MSIRTRLLLLVFAVWLPAVVGFGLLAYSTYVREAQASRDRVRQAAESLNVLVERELDKRAVMAKTLAASSAVRERDYRRFREEAIIATKDTGDWAFLFDKDFQLVNTALATEQTAPVPRRAGAPLETVRPNVYFNMSGEVVEKPVLGMFAPEANASPVQLNVGVAFRPSVIQAIVAQQELPDGSVGAVIDRDLRVMARSREPQKWFGRQATGELHRRARDGETGFAESTTLDGVPP